MLDSFHLNHGVNSFHAEIERELRRIVDQRKEPLEQQLVNHDCRGGAMRLVRHVDLDLVSLPSDPVRQA